MRAIVSAARQQGPAQPAGRTQRRSEARLAAVPARSADTSTPPPHRSRAFAQAQCELAAASRSRSARASSSATATSRSTASAPTSPAAATNVRLRADDILPAKVAGVEHVVACTPPERAGGFPPPTVYAMRRGGRPRSSPSGACRRLASLAFGALRPRTRRHALRRRQRLRRRGQAAALRPVGSICSPGRPRSPSSPTTPRDPALVAFDLLGQAEHGPTSPALLIA